MSRTENVDLIKTMEEKRRISEKIRRIKNPSRNGQSRYQPPSPDPTPRQMDILKFMRSYLVQNGLSPTIREIGLAMDISSPNGVMCHLRALQRKGFVRSAGYGKSRCWMPTVADGCCKCCGQLVKSN